MSDEFDSNVVDPMLASDTDDDANPDILDGAFDDADLDVDLDDEEIDKDAA